MDDEQSKRDPLNIQNTPNTNNNTHEMPSKLKMKNKLSPFAPAFDVSHSPTINPYSGQYGISTLPAQVPPAQIPSIIPQDQQPSSNNTSAVHHSHTHVHQALYTTSADNNAMPVVDVNHNNGGRVATNVASDARRHPNGISSLKTHKNT